MDAIDSNTQIIWRMMNAFESDSETDRALEEALTILLNITLGVTGLLAIFFLKASLEKAAEEHYTAANFRDVEITASLGLSEDDLSAIQALRSRKPLCPWPG